VTNSGYQTGTNQSFGFRTQSLIQSKTKRRREEYKRREEQQSEKIAASHSKKNKKTR